MFEFVKTTREDGVVTLTIDRPKALNALNAQVLRELDETLKPLAFDQALRALIVTGGGEKAFVAGGDIAEMAAMTAEQALAFAERGQRVLGLLETLRVPTIAAVNGFALGGGCELALACDLIYASEKAKLGLPEVTLAVIPGFGGTQRLPRLVGHARALELICTGEAVDAKRAKEIGLVLEVLAPEALLPHCRAIAKKIAKRGPVAVAEAKRVIHTGPDVAFHEACEIERRAFATLFSTTDQREGMNAFVEKRPAIFTGQ